MGAQVLICGIWYELEFLAPAMLNMVRIRSVRRRFVSRYTDGSNFSLAMGSASRKVCIGVFPLHHRP